MMQFIYLLSTAIPKINLHSSTQYLFSLKVINNHSERLFVCSNARNLLPASLCMTYDLKTMVCGIGLINGWHVGDGFRCLLRNYLAKYKLLFESSANQKKKKKGGGGNRKLVSV